MKQLIGMLALGLVLGAGAVYSLSSRPDSSEKESRDSKLSGTKEVERETRLDLAEGQVRVEELPGMENYEVLFGTGKGIELSAYRYAGGFIDFSIEMDGKIAVDPARTAPIKVENITGLTGYFGWLRIPEGESQERWFFGNQTFVVPARLAQVPVKLSLFNVPFPDQDPSHKKGGGFGESIRDLFTNKIPEGGRQKTDPSAADGTPFPFPKDRPVCLKAYDIRRIDPNGNVIEKHNLRLIARVISLEELHKRSQPTEAK